MGSEAEACRRAHYQQPRLNSSWITRWFPLGIQIMATVSLKELILGTWSLLCSHNPASRSHRAWIPWLGFVLDVSFPRARDWNTNMYSQYFTLWSSRLPGMPSNSLESTETMKNRKCSSQLRPSVGVWGPIWSCWCSLCFTHHIEPSWGLAHDSNLLVSCHRVVWNEICVCHGFAKSASKEYLLIVHLENWAAGLRPANCQWCILGCPLALYLR